MKKITLFSLPIILLFGCLKKCYDPIDTSAFIELKVLNKADSTNLLFGSKRIYNFDKKMFYYKFNFDTAFLNNLIYEVADNSTTAKDDSIVVIKLYSGMNKIYMQLASGIVDSFEITYDEGQFIDGVNFSYVNGVKYNAVTLPKAYNNIYSIYK